jgi:integrase/recombinase XerC
VFPGDDEGHLSPRWLGKKANRLLPDHWTIHSLRHRFANRAIEATGDLSIVQDLLEHASPATTRVYVVVNRSNMCPAVRAAAGVGPVSVRALTPTR